MEQLSASLLLTAGILLLIAGVIFAIFQVWLYTDLLWAGAFGSICPIIGIGAIESQSVIKAIP